MTVQRDINRASLRARKARYFDQPNRRGRPGRLAPEGSAIITRRITALAVVLGIIMAVGKFFLWRETHSIGLLSSLVHSGLDMFGAISSFIAVRYAARRPDDKYRYGRGKAESFSAVFQVCLVVFAGFHLLEAVIDKIGHSHPIDHSSFAIFVLLVFVVLTGWLLIWQSAAIRSTGSIAVRGDRAHYFADFLANLVVIIGIALSSFTPLYWADSMVGMLMAFWLFFTAFQIGRLAWAQLMDMELNEDERISIKCLAMQDPDVRAVHDLRTRASGPHLHIQMRLDLDEVLTLSQAHDVVLAAEARLMAAFPAADILIHPHPAGCKHNHGNARFRDKTAPP